MGALPPLRACAIVVGSALLVGCYTYVPVERPAPGTSVRIHVPLRSVADQAGRGPRSVSFEGTVLALSDTLVLEVKSRRPVGAFRELVELDTLRVAVGELSGVEERLLSKPKTYAFAVVVVGGAAGLAVAAVEVAGGGGGEGPGDETPRGAVVLNRIPAAVLKLLGR